MKNHELMAEKNIHGLKEDEAFAFNCVDCNVIVERIMVNPSWMKVKSLRGFYLKKFSLCDACREKAENKKARTANNIINAFPAEASEAGNA